MYGTAFLIRFLFALIIIRIMMSSAFVLCQTKNIKPPQLPQSSIISSEKKSNLTPQLDVSITTPTTEKKEETEMYNYKDPEPPPTSSIIFSLIKAVVGLAIIAFLIYITVLLLKIGMSKKSPLASGSISILESFYFAPNKSIQIVDIAGTIYIIGVSEKGIDLIKEVKEKEEIDKIKSMISPTQITFKSYLNSFTKIFSGQKNQTKQAESDLSSNIDFKGISSLKESINKLKMDK